MTTNSDLLDVCDAVVQAKKELESAQVGVQYYERVLEQAKARVSEKTVKLEEAMAQLGSLG